jgi:hypothetical protein
MTRGSARLAELWQLWRVLFSYPGQPLARLR